MVTDFSQFIVVGVMLGFFFGFWSRIVSIFVRIFDPTKQKNFVPPF